MCSYKVDIWVVAPLTMAISKLGIVSPFHEDKSIATFKFSKSISVCDLKFTGKLILQIHVPFAKFKVTLKS